MLKCDNLSFRFSKNGKPVRNGASLKLGEGEIEIVLGKNGSGKTTLFKNVIGINTPEGGSISFDGENILKMPRRERARRIAYVPQNIQFGALSVFDSILMGRISCYPDAPGFGWSDRAGLCLGIPSALFPVWCENHPHRYPAGASGRIKRDTCDQGKSQVSFLLLECCAFVGGIFKNNLEDYASEAPRERQFASASASGAS